MQYDLDLPSGLLGVELAGIAGYPLPPDRVVAIDYRSPAAHLLDRWRDPAALPGRPATALHSTPFRLMGPKTIIVPVRVEGDDAERWALVDTGTSSMVVSQSLFDAIGAGADGRCLLRGSKSVTSAGASDAPIFRLRSVRVGDAEARQAWAAVAPDAYLARISRQTGVDLSVILGGAFLREFFVVIDYPGSTPRLAPYEDQGHLPAEFRAVGIEVVRRAGEGGGAHDIFAVYEGSDAEAQGLRGGDRLVELDGERVAGMALSDVLERPRGAPGTRVALKAARGDVAFEVGVQRDGLLPALE